ncbi:hypothetical protein [Nocardia sp. NPDC024068]|uniref:hypothetical protein n=1 Tax=Nocardia sp. NPDC024068 TaxID=3157197 RepID=UPI00340EB2F0
MDFANTVIQAEGLRLTQGWGSAGTIVVGLVAVGVASYWNYRTLKRTDERYEKDLREAHDDKVRDAILEVLHKTTIWATAANDFRALVRRRLIPGPSNQAQATDAEIAIRAGAKLHSDAQMNLRRALWAAQLVVDEPSLHAAIVSTIATQEELVSSRTPAEWTNMVEAVEKVHELRIRTNSQVDEILRFAQANLAKRRQETAEAAPPATSIVPPPTEKLAVADEQPQRHVAPDRPDSSPKTDHAQEM